MQQYKTAYMIGNSSKRYKIGEQPFPMYDTMKVLYRTKDLARAAVVASQRVNTGSLGAYYTDIYTVSGNFEPYGDMLQTMKSSSVVVTDCHFDCAVKDVEKKKFETLDFNIWENAKHACETVRFMFAMLQDMMREKA